VISRILTRSSCEGRPLQMALVHEAENPTGDFERTIERHGLWAI
jgi:hypothetical protein